MSIYFGNDTVNDLYIGLTPVTKGYVGTHLFYNGDNTIIDLTYEKYILNTQSSTLYNTAEKPVKSAILKGQTLVNLQSMMSIIYQNSNDGTIVKEDNRIIFTSKSTNVTNIRVKYVADTSKTYTVKCKLFNNSSSDIKFLNHTIFIDSPLATVPTGETSSINFKFKPHSASVNMGVFLFINHGLPRVIDEEVVIEDLVILEGDYTNVDIPYFEDMQSVKMPVLTTTGKNLFDGEIEEGVFDSNGNPSDYVGRTRSKNFIKVPKNTDLYISMSGAKKASWTSIYFYNDKKEYTESLNTQDVNKTFNTGNNSYIKWKNDSPMSQITNVQIEQGSVATSYEPYQSNILTVNEDVELRGIGKVKDELNLVTGELNQYVGQTIYTDSSAFYVNNPYKVTEEKTIGFRTHAAVQGIKQMYGGATVFSSLSGSVKANSDNPGVSYQWHSLIIRVNKEDLPTLDVAGLDTYLKERPLVVQYELATEVVKTVDLSIVNQDGNDTNLSTFNDITHVMVSSGGLISVVELEVATKNEEVLNTMSLEMDNISTTQNTLEETSNAQSENVDATMIATTEIYEQLL